jgi:hypothetical protein
VRIREKRRDLRRAFTACAVVASVGLAGLVAACDDVGAPAAAPARTAEAAVLDPASTLSTTTSSLSASATASAKPTPKASKKPKKPQKPVVPISRSRVEPKPHPSATPTPSEPLLPAPVPLQAVSPPVNVFGPDFPDPEVIYDAVRHAYFAFGTNTIGENVQRLVSTDGAHWLRMSDALPTLPADAVAGGTWAPNVRFNAVSGRWVMTFAYLSRSTNTEMLGVATASAPDATFVPRATALRSIPDGHVIDPDSLYVNGVPYLVSVEARADGNRFVVQQQTPDALGLVGAPVVLASAPYVLEGPTLLIVGDTVICVFASGQTGVWNQPGYSTWYVEDSVARVFGQQGRLDLHQARPLVVSWPGSARAPGEPATALDPLTGNFASTGGTLLFYTNDLHKETLFGTEYDARYLMAYPVRIGAGEQSPGGPIALWSPPPTPAPKPTASTTPHPTPKPAPKPVVTRTPAAPTPKPTTKVSPKPTVRPTTRPTPSRTPSPTPKPAASQLVSGSPVPRAS